MKSWDSSKIYVVGGRRLAVRNAFSDYDSDDPLCCTYSPRNDNRLAEGCWSDFVALARAILALEDDRLRQATVKTRLENKDE